MALLLWGIYLWQMNNLPGEAETGGKVGNLQSFIFTKSKAEKVVPSEDKKGTLS